MSTASTSPASSPRLLLSSLPGSPVARNENLPSPTLRHGARQGLPSPVHEAHRRLSPVAGSQASHQQAPTTPPHRVIFDQTQASLVNAPGPQISAVSNFRGLRQGSPTGSTRHITANQVQVRRGHGPRVSSAPAAAPLTPNQPRSTLANQPPQRLNRVPPRQDRISNFPARQLFPTEPTQSEQPSNSTGAQLINFGGRLSPMLTEVQGQLTFWNHVSALRTASATAPEAPRAREGSSAEQLRREEQVTLTRATRPTATFLFQPATRPAQAEPQPQRQRDLGAAYLLTSEDLYFDPRPATWPTQNQAQRHSDIIAPHLFASEDLYLDPRPAAWVNQGQTQQQNISAPHPLVSENFYLDPQPATSTTHSQTRRQVNAAALQTLAPGESFYPVLLTRPDEPAPTEAFPSRLTSRPETDRQRAATFPPDTRIQQDGTIIREHITRKKRLVPGMFPGDPPRWEDYLEIVTQYTRDGCTSFSIGGIL